MNTATTFNRPSNLMQSAQPSTRKSALAPTLPQESLEFRHFADLVYLTTLTTSPPTASQNALIPLANSVSVDIMKSGAATKITIARVWVVMLVLSVGLLGIAAGQACTRTFFSVVVQLMPCRPAVASLSPAPPNEACCNAVRTLGQPCLCALADGPPITGVNPNMTMQLPGKCTANFAPCNSRV